MLQPPSKVVARGRDVSRVAALNCSAHADDQQRLDTEAYALIGPWQVGKPEKSDFIPKNSESYIFAARRSARRNASHHPPRKRGGRPFGVWRLLESRLACDWSARFHPASITLAPPRRTKIG